MLISTKSGVPEKDRNASISAAEVVGRVVQHDQTWASSEPTTKTGTASCIGSDMSIVGNIECKGPAQILGRIEGEVRASDLQISDGAQIEGSVIAQNVTICGRVKGTIRAVRVKLQNGGAVEGVDEHIQFWIAGQHLGGQSAHRGLRREVGDECRHRRSPPGRRVDASHRKARPGLAATDDGEVRAECGERLCRRQPNAISGTRDQNLLVVHGTAIQG
jgi:NDP-sugar pyrophosphorylase family protein